MQGTEGADKGGYEQSRAEPGRCAGMESPCRAAPPAVGLGVWAGSPLVPMQLSTVRCSSPGFLPCTRRCQRNKAPAFGGA